MASDIALLLAAEHRVLAQLADRAERSSRGVVDPVAELQCRLTAHAQSVRSDVLPMAERRADEVEAGGLAELRRALDRVIDSGGAGRSAAMARTLVAHERVTLVPVLERHVPIAERRRAGKVYRIHRDAAVRALSGPTRAARSRTELYEMARRAGIEHRSRMTQRELQDAVEDWEHGGLPRGTSGT
jgi:hypothetical protein